MSKALNVGLVGEVRSENVLEYWPGKIQQSGIATEARGKETWR